MIDFNTVKIINILFYNYAFYTFFKKLPSTLMFYIQPSYEIQQF